MASKKQLKPGVKTKLNSVKNRTKKREGEPSTPNPTALAGQQNLPAMELAEVDWVEETNNSPLNLALPVSSERTLGKNKLVVTKSETPEIVPEQTETPKPRKKKKKIIKQQTNKLPDKKQVSKKKSKTDKTQIMSNIKDTISKQVENMKIDYEQLAKIQAELQTAADNAQSTIKTNIEKINKYTNTAMEKAINSEVLKPSPKRAKLDITEGKIEASIKKKKEQKPAKTTEQNITKTQSNIDAIIAAYEFAAESQATTDINNGDQRLAQAIMKRNGAQKIIDSLKAQLQYAAEGERRASIEERIKQKEIQLAEANLLIEQLQDNNK